MNSLLAPALLLAAALSATALTTLSAADQPPRPIDQPSPAYPFELRKDQIEGQVTLLFTVTADGRVANPVVVQSSNWVFRDLTLAAVRKWKYTPAEKDGRPISVTVSQPFVFVIAEKEAQRAVLAAAARRAGAAVTTLAGNQ